MEPLKKVQVEGHLMFAEPQDLFGNLDELCYVSMFLFNCYNFNNATCNYQLEVTVFNVYLVLSTTPAR